jgi:hypothetical protein
MRVDRTYGWILLGAIALGALTWLIVDMDHTGSKLWLEPLPSGLPKWTLPLDQEIVEAVSNTNGDTLLLSRNTEHVELVARWHAMSSLAPTKIPLIDKTFTTPQNTPVHDFTFKTTPPLKYHSTRQQAADVEALFVHILGTYDGDMTQGVRFEGTGIQFSTDGRTIAYSYAFKRTCSGTLRHVAGPGGPWIVLQLDR